jgi:TolB protein
MLPLVALIVAGACATAINYSMNTVPEEGGIRFTQITTATDLVSGPTVTRTGENGLSVSPVHWVDVSPDGQTIAFLARKNDKQNVFVKGTQGGVATTQRTFRDNVWDPRFSHDGQHLAFVDFRNNRWNVFFIHATQGSAIRQLTNFEQVSQLPAYSPAGGKLAFVQDERSSVGTRSSTGQPGSALTITRRYVWEVDLDRNSFTQLAEGWSPSYSPDGKKMAITRNSRDHGNSEIWVVDLASGTETVVATSKDQGYIDPSFSPDGKRIVFSGNTKAEGGKPANWDLFVVAVDGTAQTQLTFHPGHDMAPRFAPDGRSIYFLSQRGSETGDWNIWRMDFVQR